MFFLIIVIFRFWEMGTSEFSWKLADHPKLPKGKIIGLVVLDGWGEANPDKYNCIHVAETPTMDSLKKVSRSFLWLFVLFFVLVFIVDSDIYVYI